MFIIQGFMAGLLVSATHAGVQEDVRRHAHEMRSMEPEVASRVGRMQPVKNRAGGLYFPGSDLMDAAAQVLIQDRILARKDPPEVRAALAYALNQEHRFPWSVVQHEEAIVRVAMLHGHKGLNEPGSTDVLIRAMADGDPGVRAEAVRLIGYRTDWQGLSEPLIAALRDSSPEVRRFSARSLGWLKIAEGFTPLRTCLDDGDPSVRAAAVRALGKIDADAARTMPKLKRLSLEDNHPAVQRELKRVVAP